MTALLTAPRSESQPSWKRSWRSQSCSVRMRCCEQINLGRALASSSRKIRCPVTWLALTWRPSKLSAITSTWTTTSGRQPGARGECGITQGSQGDKLAVSLELWVSPASLLGIYFFSMSGGGAHGCSLLQVLSLSWVKGAALPKPRTSGVAGARRLGVQRHLPPRHVHDTATWAPGAGDQICPRLGKSQDATARWGGWIVLNLLVLFIY